MANYLLKQGERARTVTVIVWLEDLMRLYGDDWESRLHGYLASLHVPVCCSPVHDQDKYTEEDVKNWIRRHVDPDTGDVPSELTNSMPRVGDLKKPHIHIILVTKGPQTREDFSKLMEDLLPIPPTRWERVAHLDTLTRYMSHMDNPEKFRYEDTAIKSWGNFSLKPLTIKKSDEYAKMCSVLELHKFIVDNNIKHYHVLVNWAINTGDYDIIACVTGRASFYAAYFKSISDLKREEKDAKKKQTAQSSEIDF